MVGESIEYWIWLQQALGAGSPKPERLLRECGGIRQVYSATHDDYAGMDFLNGREIHRLCDKSLAKSESIVQDCMKLGYSMLSPEEMPQRLRDIYAPPCVLYVWGELPNPDDGVYVAMVGTRNVTAYGVEAATKIAAGLVRYGAVVISGMALGVDAASHKGALKGGGKTIAAIGCGIDIDYPTAHRELKRLIAQNGAVVSEYAPGARPDRANFPVRNRIIAGLSLGTVVVEAGGRSGALITASLATEMGRDVFAVPGSIFSPMSEGTNKLLRDGAKPVCTVIDIMEEYMGLCPQSIIAQMQNQVSNGSEEPDQLSFDTVQSGVTARQTLPAKDNFAGQHTIVNEGQSNAAKEVAAQKADTANALQSGKNLIPSFTVHAAERPNASAEPPANMPAAVGNAADRPDISAKPTASMPTAGGNATAQLNNSPKLPANMPTAGGNATALLNNSLKLPASMLTAGVPAAGAGLSESQKAVYGVLTDTPTHVDEIALRANLELRKVLAILTTLEIQGFAQSHPGRRYTILR